MHTVRAEPGSTTPASQPPESVNIVRPIATSEASASSTPEPSPEEGRWSAYTAESATLALDGLQTALDVVGLVPGLGELADATNVGISLGRGDYIGAALSAISLVPGVGDAIGKGAKVALKTLDPALAQKTLKALEKIDINQLTKSLQDQLGPVAERLGKAVDDMIGRLEDIAGRQTPQLAAANGAPTSGSRPTRAPRGPNSTPRGTDALPTTPQIRDRFVPSAKYDRATDLGMLVPDSTAWKQAVNALREGGPDAINNIRVNNASEAKKLLTEAFPPNGSQALQHAPTYTNGAPRSYQLHPPDAQDVNDLSHIKWQTPEGEGHIFFGNPGNSGPSEHYITQRDFDHMVKDSGLTPEELGELGLRPGGNRLGEIEDGARRDAYDNRFIRPANRPGS